MNQKQKHKYIFLTFIFLALTIFVLSFLSLLAKYFKTSQSHKTSQNAPLIEDYLIERSKKFADNNWKQYIETKFFNDLLLHFPPNWNYINSQNSTYFYPIELKNNCGNTTEQIEASQGCFYLKITSLAEFEIKNPNSGLILDINTFPTEIIGNNNFLTYKNAFEGIKSTHYYLLFNKENILDLSLNQRYLNSATNLNSIGKQIISTFTMLPRNPETVDQKWETFENKKIGYKFQYPDFLTYGKEYAVEDYLIDFDTIGEPHNPNIPPAIRILITPNFYESNKQELEKIINTNPMISIIKSNLNISGYDTVKTVGDYQSQYSKKNEVHTIYYTYWTDKLITIDFYNSYNGGGIITENIIQKFVNTIELN